MSTAVVANLLYGMYNLWLWKLIFPQGSISWRSQKSYRHNIKNKGKYARHADLSDTCKILTPFTARFVEILVPQYYIFSRFQSNLSIYLSLYSNAIYRKWVLSEDVRFLSNIKIKFHGWFLSNLNRLNWSGNCDSKRSHS